MSTSTLRFALFTAIFAGLGVTLLTVPHDATAQVKVQPIAPLPPGVPDPNKPENNVLEKFNFPEDRDTNLKFDAVRDYLDNKKSIDWAVVCKLVQGLLDAKSDYFYKFETGEKKNTRVSVKEEISRIIGTFPKEGRDFYELTFGPAATSDLADAKKAGYDKSMLATVAQRYFHTKAGAEATILLARLNLEFGNYPEAAYGFQRLMTRPDADTVLDVRALFQAVVAFKRAGDTRRPEEIGAIWDRIEKKIPRDGIVFGNKSYTFDTLKGEFDKSIEFNWGTVGDAYIAMKGGNITRNGVANAGAPFLDALFGLPVLYRTDSDEQKVGADWVRAQIDSAYKRLKDDKKKVYLPAFFPVTAPNSIIFRGYDGTYSFFTKDGIDEGGKPFRTGDLNWFAPSKGAAQSIYAGESGPGQVTRNDVLNWWQYWANTMPNILFENPLLGSLSHDGKLVYTVEDLAVLPAPQQMYDQWGGFNPGGMPDNGGNKGMKDYNRLVAVEIETGRQAWIIGGLGNDPKPEDEDKITTSDKFAENSHFLGAPLPLNGKLYVLMERNGQLKMLCLDPQKRVRTPGAKMDSPELVWVQNLGRANTVLKQDPLRRMQASFMASADGIIICPTNSGAVIAVDINARSLLWAHTYSTIDRGGEVGDDNPNGGRFRGRRPFPGGGAQPLPNDRWRASNPIIVNGRVIFTAFDSEKLQCVDLRTGKVIWSDPRQPDDLYVGGVVNGSVIVVGKNSVRAVKLVGNDADPKTGTEKVTPAWKEALKIGTPLGHGVPSKDGLYYLPVLGDPDKPDSQVPAVWAIHADTGTPKSKTIFRRKEGATPLGSNADPHHALGNLVFHDGMMFSQSATEVSAFPLIEVKKAEMDLLLTKNPNDPAGLTSRGELFLDEGKLAEAVKDFKLAQTNKPDEATTRKINQKLYIAYTEILRNDFAAGEKTLDEYKTLCEFAIPEDDGTPERARAIEEQTRRKGLFYCLVAKGREKQGRLVDAFDNYRAYAALGEQGRLLAVPEDPNTMALSSVWASGRIDAMMRTAKDPAARKPLEEKVEKEWEAIKAGNDLAALENFVKTFGPYFARGRDAQFLLAERLMMTNNDADKRKSQNYLINLIAVADETAESKNTAAKATEALARLMTSRNMMDDAVGLYAKLGNVYSEVSIRDNKSGADIYGDLITDKRLLPYLEPARSRTMDNYSVVSAQVANNYNARSNSTSLVPEGDLLPYFKRHRISLDYDMNNGTNSLRVIDRVTGEERKASFGNMQQYQQWNNGQTPTTLRISQASGHLFMVHFGPKVFCYDLSQTAAGNTLKELWSVDLIGNGGVPTPNNQFNPQPALQMEGTADGDTIYRSGDGWAFRLGRSSVLQASYAVVLTRDGLVAMDPMTGTKLWTRANIAARASVYGDAKHIFLLEAGTGGTVAKAIRASDGAVLENVKDFAAILGSPHRLAVFGRQVLLAEPSTDKDGPRVVRLYDILEGKDVWKKEYPKDTAVLKTFDNEACGVVTPEGKVQILAARTGVSLVDYTLPEKLIAEHTQTAGKFALSNPALLADGDRFYVFLNRDDKGQNNPQVYWGASPVRFLPVNGACYTFDKTSGKLAWYTDVTPFQRQQICLERFDELPCLFASNPSFQEDNNPVGRGVQYMHQVMAVDKKTGILKLFKNHQSQGPFQALTQNKDGTFEFWQYNLNVKIKDEGPKKADEPKK